MKCLIAKSSNLSSLAIGTGSIYSGIGCALQVCNAIAENRTYPITFKEWHICFPPQRESNQSLATQQYAEQFSKVYSESNNQKLNVDILDELTADAIAKATTNGSGFTELALRREGQLGDSFVNNISSVVCRCELNKIEIHTKKDEGRVRILGSIQWNHLRTLQIYVKPGTFETSVMRALVDDVKKMSEKIELEKFEFWSDGGGLTLPQDDLLQAFVASTWIEILDLKLDVTLKQMLSLFESADFSRLKTLGLWTNRFDSLKVDAILDGLQHATKLNTLVFFGTTITDEQKSRMKAKGVDLYS
jgi:hypothetical protein